MDRSVPLLRHKSAALWVIIVLPAKPPSFYAPQVAIVFSAPRPLFRAHYQCIAQRVRQII